MNICCTTITLFYGLIIWRQGSSVLPMFIYRDPLCKFYEFHLDAIAFLQNAIPSTKPARECRGLSRIMTRIWFFPQGGVARLARTSTQRTTVQDPAISKQARDDGSHVSSRTPHAS